MSDKIRLADVLGILGVGTDEHGLLKLGIAKFCVQPSSEIAGKTLPLLVSSFVGIALDFPHHVENPITDAGYRAYHELLQGVLYIDLQSRHVDVNSNLRGMGLAGLATGGGLHHSSYGKKVK